MKLLSNEEGSRKISIVIRSLISGLAMNSNSRVVPTLQHQCRSTTIDLSARTRIRNAFSGLVNLIRRVRWIGKFLHRFTRGQKRIIGVINRGDLLNLISKRRELSKQSNYSNIKYINTRLPLSTTIYYIKIQYTYCIVYIDCIYKCKLYI